jgi:hypothetical protein
MLRVTQVTRGVLQDKIIAVALHDFTYIRKVLGWDLLDYDWSVLQISTLTCFVIGSSYVIALVVTSRLD